MGKGAEGEREEGVVMGGREGGSGRERDEEGRESRGGDEGERDGEKRERVAVVMREREMGRRERE